jgi:hypothetical protein
MEYCVLQMSNRNHLLWKIPETKKAMMKLVVHIPQFFLFAEWEGERLSVVRLAES